MDQILVRKTETDKQEIISQLRERMAQIDKGLGEKFFTESYYLEGKEDPLNVGGELGKILPHGAVPRRRSTQFNNCPLLIVELISRVTALGGWVAIVGWPELALAQVAEEGRVDKVISIPQPGDDPWAVISTLFEGMDLIIYHGPPSQLSPARARPVTAHMRTGRAALITVGPRLPGTELRIEGKIMAYRGIGRGTGRIRGIDISVHISTKAYAKNTMVTVGQRRKLEVA